MRAFFLLISFCQLAFAQTNTMMTPAYLKPGDTIAIVAPAGIIKNKASIHEAAALAKSWGLEVVLGKHIFDAYHHFSATDDYRLLDFQTALDQPNVKAIWCARGGYGTVRIIDDIDFSSFKKTPKWIIGYSDITVLHNAVHNLGVETLHAMMPVNMEFSESSRRQSVATFKKALFGEKLNYEIPSSSYNKTGNCKGVLVGGNLTLLENLLGSSSSISTAGKILFFEEIGEYKYHIDRLIRALDRNGYFTNCKGLLIGGMSHIKKNNPPFGQNIEELILAITETYNFPIAFDFPAGHDPENNALILGRTVEMEISTTSTKINFTK